MLNYYFTLRKQLDRLCEAILIPLQFMYQRAQFILIIVIIWQQAVVCISRNPSSNAHKLNRKPTARSKQPTLIITIVLFKFGNWRFSPVIRQQRTCKIKLLFNIHEKKTSSKELMRHCISVIQENKIIKIKFISNQC